MGESLFKSLGAVASLINTSSDLDQTLGHLLQAVCQREPWTKGAIMRVDTANGYAQTIARYATEPFATRLDWQWPLAESPARLAIERNEPIIIRDAQTASEFPGYQREAIQFGYRTVIVLPMAYRNAAGEPIVLSLRSAEAVDVSADELAFLQFVVHLGQIAMDKARSLAEEQAFGERLKAALAAHGALLDQVLADPSVASAAAMVASLLPDPPVIVDLTARQTMAGRSPVPALIDDAAWQAAMAGELGRQFLEIAARPPHGHRFEAQELVLAIDGRTLALPAIVCPLTVDRTQVGALIVFAPNPDAGDLDHLLLDSARFGLSVQMMRSYVSFVTEARSLEEVFADLFDGGRPLPDIVERAGRLRLDLSRPGRLVLLVPARRLASAALLELRRDLTHLAQRFDPRAVVSSRAGSLVVLCPDEAADLVALAERLVAECRAATGASPIAVLGKPCRQAGDYLPAWRDCERLRELAQRFGRSGLVRAEDFGPFPVLMSAVDMPEMREFVEQSIGPVAGHDRDHGTAYIETLSAFLDQNCRSQPTADALGIHVTTLRYRLDRLQDLFGLATDTPERRFALQLALQFQRVMASNPAEKTASRASSGS